MHISKSLLPVMVIVALAGSTQVIAKSPLDERLVLASPEAIEADTELQNHMTMLADQAVSEHCSSCHGADLTGQIGVPNLVDFDWIWGVTGYEMTSSEAVFEIMQTILYGVRNADCPDEIKRYGGCPDTRFSQMPGYTQLGLTDTQLNGLVDYVLALSGKPHDAGAVEGVNNLITLCAECHGENGEGYKAFGGPDLTDNIWLFGEERAQILDVIANGRTESCPAWSTRLSAASIKALAVTIYRRYMGF